MSWSDGIPVVSVPMGNAARHVTFIYPYYENHAFLPTQLEGWAAYPPELARHISVTVVDDGSPNSPAEEAITTCPAFAFLEMEIRLFRIEVDRRWNWLAARNIGAKYSCGWIVLTDMDHVIPQATARSLVYGQHDRSVVYAFSRTGDKTTPHSASFFMTREMFWQIGGYDERAAGFYGNDGPFRREMVKHAKIHILREHLECHEKTKGAATEAYARKQPEDANRPAWQQPHLTLSFPYVEIPL